MLKYQLFLLASIILYAPTAQPGGPSSANPTVGQPVPEYVGKLYQWSGQQAESNKVILFVHGRRLDIPTAGPSQELLESTFSFKIANFESLGQTLFGKPTSALAEYWFYGYYPQQSLSAIAADLAQQIQTNSALRGKQIAVVGYSEGGLVCWLLDQRYSLIQGGVLLGAPILGTPLADKPTRDAAIRKILPIEALARKLSDALDQYAKGSLDLANSYLESGQPKSQLMLYAGRIQPASPGLLTRDFLDELGNQAATGPEWQTSNKRIAEAEALVIANSVWRDNSVTDKQSDGLVPVSSATCGGISNSKVWDEYDHYELLTGAGLEIALDQATLSWLGRVLQLTPEFAAGNDIPHLPGGSSSGLPRIDIPKLPEINLNQTDLLSYRFAYVHDGKLAFTDREWSTSCEFETGGKCSYPRFAPNGKSLVFTNDTSGNSAVYRLAGQPESERIVAGRWADFSPNVQWLVYEGNAGLCTWRFSQHKEYCLVENVHLVCPPLWVTKGLLGRVYFIARKDDGTTGLYVVSPRARHKQLSQVALVEPNCQALFLSRGLISGVVAMSCQPSKCRLSVISNWLQSAISFEVNPDQNGMESLDCDWWRWQFKWSTGWCGNLQSALFDPKDHYALYLEMADQSSHLPGIYLFSIKRELNGFSFQDSYEMNEVMASACNLDLNPAASN